MFKTLVRKYRVTFTCFFHRHLEHICITGIKEFLSPILLSRNSGQYSVTLPSCRKSCQHNNTRAYSLHKQVQEVLCFHKMARSNVTTLVGLSAQQRLSRILALGSTFSIRLGLLFLVSSQNGAAQQETFGKRDNNS